MTIKTYYKNKLKVKAIQWTVSNFDEIKSFLAKNKQYFSVDVDENDGSMFLSNKENDLSVMLNDYIFIHSDYIFKRSNALRCLSKKAFEKIYSLEKPQEELENSENYRKLCLEELKKQLVFYAKNDYDLFFTPAFESTYWEYGNKYFDLYVGDSGYIDVLGLNEKEQEQIESFYKTIQQQKLK